MARGTQVQTFITAEATTAAAAVTAFNTAVNSLVTSVTGPIGGLSGIAGLTPSGPRIISGSDGQAGDYQYTAFAYITYQTQS